MDVPEKNISQSATQAQSSGMVGAVMASGAAMGASSGSGVTGAPAFAPNDGPVSKPAEAKPSEIKPPEVKLPEAEPAPAEIFIRVSEDKLRGFFQIRPPKVVTKIELTADYIRQCWKEFGLDPDHLDVEVVDEMIQAWLKTHSPVAEKLVAETPFMPVKGEDARFEYLVDPNLNVASAEDKSSIDFKDLNLIKPVAKNQPLVKKHPAFAGAPGADLFGKPSLPVPGVDKEFPRGLNTEISSTDPSLLIASVSGFLQQRDGLILVNECFIVDGSVDYSTGNITYEQSAIIHGDVSDGFVVNVGGALEIGGAVGEAKLIVGGDVLIKKGFVGAGTGLITSKGNVTLGFASNQSIRAHGEILLEKESFNCKIFSRKMISVLGPIVGGQAMAFAEIQCRVAGNEMGTKTEIELGIDYIMHENKILVEDKLKELTSHLAKISLKLKALREIFRSRKRFTADEAKLMLELRNMHEKIQSRLPELEKRKQDILEQIRVGYLREDIRLRVEKKVFAGVSIKMGSECMRIQEAVPGPRLFTYSQGRIKVF